MEGRLGLLGVLDPGIVQSLAHSTIEVVWGEGPSRGGRGFDDQDLASEEPGTRSEFGARSGRQLLQHGFDQEWRQCRRVPGRSPVRRDT